MPDSVMERHYLLVAAPPRCATKPEPDVRKAFRSERAVYDALRLVIELRKVGSYKRRDYSANGA
jgi:hypothetical protein